MASAGSDVDVMIVSIFRTAHALGLPLVPEVYINAVISCGVRFAGWRPVGENFCKLSAVTSSTWGDILSNEDRLNAKCGKSTQTCGDRSGVEMIDFAPETFKQ